MNNIVGLWHNLFRAIEVAKGLEMSVSVWFNDDYTNAIDDYKLIKNHCRGWFDNFVANGDINVTISKPSKYTQEGNFESLNDISARIESYKQHETPSKMSHVAIQMLDAFDYHLCLSLRQINKIRTVAMHLSKMDNCNIVESNHISEAISYVSVDEDLTNADSCHVTFGGINIELSNNLSQDDIKSAVKYLTDMTV